ncbi:MAG: hypothetical protein IKM02_04025, partial [Clostridia bacterium]|nr:hypothetical protein [Clostridia bacterium]
ASDSPVMINGVPAEKDGDCYRAEASISIGENRITARNACDCREIRVFRFDGSIGSYRLSSDDNIIFLWDIHKNRDTYASIFDNPYLAVYKKAHDLYGAKVHLNLFYGMEEMYNGFDKKRADFNLSMMTDRFKAEWQANADWLKLNFHAMSNEPECPYRDTVYRRIHADCERVQKEIIRFAGEEVLSEETTVHWGECTREGVQALRDLGIRTLAGYFWMCGGKPMVAYHYPEEMVRHIGSRDFWYDRDLNVMFAVIDDVMNMRRVQGNMDVLDKIYAQKTRAGFLEIMIHEQYFYEDYVYYIPEFEEIVLECCKWASRKGYKGAFLNEIV